MVRQPLTAAQIAAGQRLGVALRAARAGRSLVEVALAAGISPETLRKIESGRVAQAVEAGFAALLGVLTVTGVVELWMVYLLSFLLGTATAFDMPARQAS